MFFSRSGVGRVMTVEGGRNGGNGHTFPSVKASLTTLITTQLYRCTFCCIAARKTKNGKNELLMRTNAPHMFQ